MLELWIILSVVAVLVIYLKQKHASAHPLPPAIPGHLPIIGHTYLVAGTTTELWKFLKDVSLHCIQQGGVTHGKFGIDTYYIITDPEDAQTVANTCLSKEHILYHYMAGVIGNGLLTIRDDTTWKRHRKAFGPAFAQKNINPYIGLFNSQARNIVKYMNKDSENGPVDLWPHLKEMTMKTTLSTIFGNKLENHEEPYYKYAVAIEKSANMLVDRFSNLWLHNNYIYRLLGYVKKVEVLQKDLSEIFDKAIQVRAQNKDSLQILTLDDRFRTFLEVFLQAPDSDSFSDEDLKSEVNNTIAAASESSASQVLIILFHLAKHPKIQERVYQEIMEVVGESKDFEKEDLVNLKYTEAVVKESLRIAGAAPIIIRHVDKDTKLKNYTLRAGTYAIVSLYGIHHHPDWVDPHQFRPERWLQPDTLPKNAFFPFAIGKRVCVGKAYAMTTVTVMVAHIVRTYRLTTDSDEMVSKFEISIKPVSGHEIAIQRRKH